MNSRNRCGTATGLVLAMLAATPALGQSASPATATPAQAPTTSANDTTTAGQVATDAPQASAASINPQPSTPEDASVKDIVVTGSRVARSGYTAPTPTTIVSSELREQQGLTGVASLLNTIPAFSASSTPATGTFAFTGAGGNFVNLRALGANRTLVLVDGARVVPSTTVGTVDLNLIPALAIDRADVVTGGASAAYGSDAISGVVNLVLLKKYHGLKLEAQGGVSQQGDSSEQRIALLAGTGFADGRGNVMIAGEYDNNNGIGNFQARDWSRRFVGINVGAGGVRYIAPDYQTSTQTFGGIINAGPLKGTAFGPGGIPYAFQYGNQFGNAASTTQAGGGNPGSFNNDQQLLQLPVERYSALAKIDYDFSDHLRGHLTGNFAYSGSVHPTVEPRDAAIVVRRDNAYLPAATAAAMDAAGVTTITVGRNDRDIGPYVSNSRNRTYRVAGTLEGDFASTFHWDVNAGYGENHFISELSNLRINGRFALAADAVRNSAGQVVCRSALTDPTSTCVPFNIFGEQNVTDSQRAYLNGTSTLRQTTRQFTGSANLRGDLFSTWAGPVSVAVGSEYRRDSVTATSDAVSQANGFDVSNPKPISGAINVYEFYGEAVVPLVRDLPFVKAIDANGAVRQTHYSTAGSVTTWKLGGTWEVNDSIRFRGTRSRDIRAPNLSEVYTAQQSGSAQIFYNGVSIRVPTITSGNPSLRPEIADTYSFGVGLSPTFLRGFRASIDYYNIDIKDAIAVIPQQTLLNGCTAGNQAYCSRITFTNGVPTLLNFSAFNVNEVKNSGIDFEVGYGSRVGPGRLDVSVLATYVAHLITTDTSGTYDRAGEVGGGISLPGIDAPHWTGDTNVHYTVGGLGLNLHLRYIAKSKLDNFLTDAQIDHNVLERKIYTNIGFDYNLPLAGGDRRNFQIFGNINNLFDVDPPYYFPLQTFQSNVSASNYDVVGRAFTAGIRIKY